MATFAKKSFNASVYAASRPTYPKALFDYIFAYHESGPRWDLAVDLGCGTGQATIELTPFKKVVGVEPGEKMLDAARKYLNERIEGSRFEFVNSSAEDLSFLAPSTVDLVIAAQAAHWFDYSKLWPELDRVLRPSGTVAFWVYSEFRLPAYPSLTPLITDYAQGTDPATSLGPHWQRPGRTILENHLLDVPEPSWGKTDRVYFTGSHYPGLPSPLPVILRTKTTWGALLTYFRSWSSLHTYLEHGGEGIEVRFWNALREGAAKEGNTAVEESDELMVEWPIGMMLVKKGEK
ncbi:S-adenosyl-L-methionine-dependent methyltransferase [Armillaria borealis]|uniref:S-adenosyl-L-methionine-dependent methyltransferase n=1 Tax=Armillaria borealis TaxID=47425 RepID=A0AA39MQA6_9AGAR|nr:S-adenosyl-L-methionine-dependent methyltransferase [Armillaria borealis]